MTRQTNICDGCLLTGEVYLTYGESCQIMVEGAAKVCPCVDCLIKMICEIPCKPRERLQDEIKKMGGDVDHETLQKMLSKTYM